MTLLMFSVRMCWVCSSVLCLFHIACGILRGGWVVDAFEYMTIPQPPEELDTQVPDKQGGVGFQLFTSLLLVRRGWFAPEKLDAQNVEMQRRGQFLFLTSLLHFRSGWFANQALHLTAAGRRGCNRRVSWPPSRSWGR